jgi:PD-(D/E)XK endonuclease
MDKAKGAPRGCIPARERSSVQKAAYARGVEVRGRGDLGEVAFVHKAMGLGFVVAKPYGQNHRYDFIVESGKSLWRVQVKTCAARLKKGSYGVSVRRSLRGTMIAYTETEFDFVVV